MKYLLTVRNRIESFYKKHSWAGGYILRLVVSFLALLILRQNTGYNTFLSNIWFIVGFSIVCGFMPTRLMLILMLAYAAVQIFTLSIGIGVSALIIMAIMYLLYLRLDARYAYVILLIPLLALIRLPLVVPLVLAVVAPFSSLVAVIFGNIVHFMIRYVNINAAIYSGMTDTTELTKMTLWLRGFFSYKELLYTTAILAAVFIIAYYIKKINILHSSEMACAIGAGVYLVLVILAQLAFGQITPQRLVYAVVGSVVGFGLAVLFENLALPFDYSRTEMLEFDDEEYHYYVRAVPKASIDRENVKVTRINRRKQAE